MQRERQRNSRIHVCIYYTFFFPKFHIDSFDERLVAQRLKDQLFQCKTGKKKYIEESTVYYTNSIQSRQEQIEIGFVFPLQKAVMVHLGKWNSDNLDRSRQSGGGGPHNHNILFGKGYFSLD